MGVWGTGPFDNDTASDMVADLMDPIRKVLELPLSVPRKNRHRGKNLRHIASDYYDEARVSAAFLLFAHGADILGGPSLQTVLDALQKIRSDEEWLGSWKKTDDIRKALDSQIRAIKAKDSSLLQQVQSRQSA